LNEPLRHLGSGTKTCRAGNQRDLRTTGGTVDTEFGRVTLVWMMDCPSELALRAGDQVKLAGKAELDPQQHASSSQFCSRLIVSKLIFALVN